MKKFKKALISEGGNTTTLHIETEAILNNNPFGNCQVYSVAHMGDILDPWNNYSKEDKLQYLKEINKKAKKPQLICDIYERLSTELEKLFTEEDIVFKQPYKSTNGSKMVMYLIKTQSLK